MYNVTLKLICFCATTVAMEKQYALHILRVCVYSLSYPACNEQAPYYVIICGLSGSTLFFHNM